MIYGFDELSSVVLINIDVVSRTTSQSRFWTVADGRRHEEWVVNVRHERGDPLLTTIHSVTL